VRCGVMSVRRLMTIQDTLPSLVEINYSTSRPHLEPLRKRDAFSTVDLSHMSTTMLNRALGGDNVPL
jgi:hypothetical protein